MYKENLVLQPLPPENISFLSPKVRQPPRTYEIRFDQNRVIEEKNNVSSLEDYERRKEQFLSYIPTQMETNLGERFNVSLSQFEYDIKDGQMWGRDMDEPFIDSIKRGRDYRKENGNPVDVVREEAEVMGFEKIQSVLLEPETPIGTMMLSISLRGGKDSTYQHNFYDIFTLKQTKTGKRYIEVRRYGSALGVEDYQTMLLPFANIEIDSKEPAASLLKNPIAIQNTFTAENLHRYLHEDYPHMEEKKFELVKKHCKSLISEYAKSVWENPKDMKNHALLFNTILNKADEVAGRIEVEGFDVWQKIPPISTPLMINEDISQFGFKQVREVMTGCGSSEGYDVSKDIMNSPFSVSEFGLIKTKKAENDPNLCKCEGEKAHFHCPGKKEGKDCKHKIVVGRGISKCPSCGEGKRC